MLICRDVNEQANEYLDGELGFWAEMKIRMHLLTCKACYNFIEQLRTVISLVQARSDNAPLDGSEEELIAAFRKQSSNFPK